MNQEHRTQPALKVNNTSTNNEFNNLVSKLASTMVLNHQHHTRPEKENVNMEEQHENKPDKMDHSSSDLKPTEVAMDIDNNAGTRGHSHPLLSESNVTAAITTLEALLKTEPDTRANPHSKLLKRLNSTARTLVLRGIVSKRNQRHKLQELLAKHDMSVAKNKGIRVLRGFKAAKLKEAFNQHEQDGTSPLPLPPPLPVSAPVNIDQDSTNSTATSADATEPSSSSSSSSSAYNYKFECYVCKSYAFKSHHFYDQMCSTCGEHNFKKRTQTASLSGRVALVSGGRIKIGYETALILLRAGAHVVITSRFPHDAAFRYSKEADFEEWKGRLDIFGVDFRFLHMVEAFCAYMNQRYEKLDILIQNAAQTIRRPVQFYKHLLEFEERSLPIELQSLVKEFGTGANPANPALLGHQKPAAIEFEGQRPSNPPVQHSTTVNRMGLNVASQESLTTSYSSSLSQLLVHPEDSLTPAHLLPVGVYDEHHQQLDLRSDNSWVLQLDQVDTTELVEVQLVNSIAPFIILNKLTPLMAKGREGRNDNDNNNYGWIIMVSSMEGKFTRSYKTTAHPHTNAAKAALNMLVRTSASYYKSKYNLLLNAVDTGWVTDEDPVPLQGKRRTKFHPPLDEIDGAARVVDPIFQTLNEGKLIYGVFLKDYAVSTW